MRAAAATGSTLQNVTDNQKRWLVFGIALNKVLVTLIRSFVEQEVQKEYGNLQASHSIHTQSTSGRLKNWPTFLKYENINGNDVFPRLGGGRYDYSKFDCRVASHVDFAKLYVENHMAKFNAFDEHCDASAVLALLGKVPVFSLAVQSAANYVRQARNAWAHCVFSDWDPLSFPMRFAEMEKLVKSLGLLCANEMYLVNELKDWETKGSTLCMNATIDPDLQKTVQQYLYELKNDIDQMTFEEEVSREKIKKAIHDSQLVLEELREKVARVEHEQEVIKQNQSTTQDQMSELKSEHEDVQRRITSLEDQQKSNEPQINHEIASCESDITFLAARHDADTRQWLLKDFNKWFSDPADSRAYVLLGDPGVGKSVIAGVLAQRSKKAGNLGAAYFCRHNDSTRNDPRCLLGTIASQLCECCSEYNSIMGGEGAIRNLLGSSNLGVQELFTKLLQEPLGRCNSTFCHQRKLVVVDALDETQYESREDFLDLIMNRFPVLPHWLVFFITSRPENTVQLTLKKYNPCVRICSGNVEHDNFYQQHERDIKLFLRNSVDFSRLPFSVDDLATKCNGSFLYAFYIAKDLNSPMQSGKSSQLVDLFPGDFDNFLRKNFKRVFEKVGCSLFKKLFGCAIAAPAPLPVSFISYVLQREKLKIPKQHVLDALSLFMVLSKTFTFLHSLIPAWLTDEDKARELFIDWNTEANYLKDVIHEILFGFIREQSQDVSVIKPDLLEYVLRVGIRFLSGFPGKDSSETVFSCLTSFKYIQNRIQSRRIEIYSVIEDFRLAATCQFSHEDRRKEIVLKVCMALERNIFILLECPYLLHSCLENASKVVQDNVVIPDGVSSTWLECNSLVLPSKRPYRHDQSNYALSPDGKVLAYINRQERIIFFVDSCSLDMIFNLQLKWILLSNHLEFSPDGKFLFFGRLDRWLSLEKRNYENFPQFSGLNSSYEWGSFTLDKRWIVVKPYSFLFESSYSCCWLCLLNYLCLWAAKEIVEGQESETVCGCFPDRLLVQIRPSAGEDQDSSVPAMRILLNILRRTHHNEWCSLLEKLQLSYRFQARCRYCPSRMSCETPTLTVVRDFVICHYNDVFKYQVWDVHTGRSALEQAFFSGVQLSPFTYLCHLGTALEKCGVLFSGIDKALSLCNIALLSAVCHHLFFFECFRRTCAWEEFVVSEKFSIMNSLNGLNSELSWYHLESNEKFKFVEACHFGTNTLTNSPLDLHNLPDVKQKGLFTSILPCVSPDGKWIAIRLEGDKTTVQLYRGQHQRHDPYSSHPVYVLKEVKHFAFTKDSVFILYLTVLRSLHTLSLVTGSILTSVCGLRPLHFTPEKQAGYCFQDDDEETNIFVKDFPTVFLSSLLPVVRAEPMQVAFASADAILVLYSDCKLALILNDGIGIASETSLVHPFGGSQQVRKVQFSPDGKLIVTHQGTNILLYSTVPVSDEASTEHGKCLRSVFETKDDFNVQHFTFSADSALLLFCIRRNIGLSFFVWNVHKKVLSASFDPLGLMFGDCCCCFSLDSKELIICTEYYIDFWDHSSRPCRLLRRVKNDVPYNENDEFTHCAVSPKNDLLAYCITDRILLCPLKTSTNQSIRQLPRAHLGKVEFCQFLRGSRYLISYGVDGTVFLWDLSEWKVATFAKIVQRRESIVSMAVSAEGDRVVCVTSFGRLNIIKPFGLKDAMLSKSPLPKEMGSEMMSEAFRGQSREPTAAIHNLQQHLYFSRVSRSSDNTEDFDVAELIEEMDFMLHSDDSEGSNEPDELLD